MFSPLALLFDFFYLTIDPSSLCSDIRICSGNHSRQSDLKIVSSFSNTICATTVPHPYAFTIPLQNTRRLPILSLLSCFPRSFSSVTAFDILLTKGQLIHSKPQMTSLHTLCRLFESPEMAQCFPSHPTFLPDLVSEALK